MVNGRQYRTDLFYRLSAFPIEPPPLRNLAEEIRLFSPPFCNAVRRSDAQTNYGRFRGIHGGSYAAFLGQATCGNCKT
jgi:transcriptional regulator with GAF, ATPase, and Fis domain